MNVTDALAGLVGLIWVAVVALIVLAVMRSYRGLQIKATLTTLLILAAVAIVLTTINMGLVFIEPEERGVVISAVADGGVRQEALEPGLRFIVPAMERVETYSIAQQTFTMSGVTTSTQAQEIDDAITARTSDGQEVFVDASVIFSLDPTQIVQVHILWKERYADGLVRPLVRGIIRDAISQYGIEEVYSSKRAEMAQLITETLDQKLRQNGLMLSEFVLRNITFSAEYAASVEQKQVAEQQAQQAHFVVEQRKQEAEQARQVAQGQADAAVIRAEGEAESRIIQAKAEAEALQLLAQALVDNPDLLTYTYINKLAPGIQVMLVPSESPYLLPLPTLEAAQAAVPTPQPTAAPTATP